MTDVHALMRAESTPGPLVIRTIGVMDLKDALARGMSDFSAMPTHALFLCLIYPIVGLMLARVTFGHDVLSLLFPLAAGFALLGPFAAIGLYELSRQREQGLDPSWQDAFDVLHVPSRGAIAALGFLLLAVFVLWIAVAEAIYVANFGSEPAASIPDFVRQLFTTPAGWMLIIVGNGIGFLFALAVLIISVVSFPLLLDRDVGAIEAALTSVRAVAANPVPMAIWGLIVASLLIIGSLPFFVGLAVVVPVLGHSTWHLYRKVVEPDPSARHEHLPAPEKWAPLCRTISGRSLRWQGAAKATTSYTGVRAGNRSVASFTNGPPRDHSRWHRHGNGLRYSRNILMGRSVDRTGRRFRRCSPPVHHRHRPRRKVVGVRREDSPCQRDGIPIGLLGMHRAAVRPFTQKQRRDR